MDLTEKILILAVGMLVIIFISVGWLNKSDTLKQLKDNYEAALQGFDKEAAQAAGRAYYRSLRGSELTIEDEQAIISDIDNMQEAEL